MPGRSPSPLPPRQHEAVGPRCTGSLVLTSVLLVQLVASALVLAATGAQFVSTDEYSRLVYALEWAWAPFFAPSDHHWLGGNFWLLGTLISLGVSSPWSGVIHGLASGVALVSAAWWLARAMGLSPWAAAATALMLTLQPVVLVLSKSPQPDLLAVTLILLAVAAWTRFWSRTAGRPAGPSLALIAGTLALVAGQTLRYETWFFSAIFGGLVLAMGWRSFRAGAIGQGIAWTLLGATLGVFPLLWMASSASVLGGPLRFLDGISLQLLHGGTPELDLSNGWHRAAFHPLYVTWQAPALVPLAVLGSRPLFLRTSLPGRRLATALLLGFILLVELLTVIGGTGDNWRFRISTVVLVPVVILAGAGLSDLLAARRPGPLRIAMVAALLAANFAFIAHQAPTFTDSGEPPNEEIVILGDWMRAHARAAPEAPLLVWARMPSAEGFHGFEEWVLSTHAGSNIVVIAAEDEKDWLGALAADEDYRHFVTSVPPSNTPGLDVAAKMGEWMLLSRDLDAWSKKR